MGILELCVQRLLTTQVLFENTRDIEHLGVPIPETFHFAVLHEVFFVSVGPDEIGLFNTGFAPSKKL